MSYRYNPLTGKLDVVDITTKREVISAILVASDETVDIGDTEILFNENEILFNDDDEDV